MGDKYKVGTGQSKSSLTGSIESDALQYLTLPVPRSLKSGKIKSYEIEASLKGHKKAVYCCAFEPTQGFYIATCSHDMTCVVWDIRTNPVCACPQGACWLDYAPRVDSRRKFFNHCIRRQDDKDVFCTKILCGQATSAYIHL